MFELLRCEICQTEVRKEIQAQITPEFLKQLYTLSKHHDLAHLIGNVLDRMGMLQSDAESGAKFQKQQMMAVYRYERINYELNIICHTLEEEHIPFIPLKGSVIRKFYPEPWMRTSCDIDVLVHKEDLEQAAQALTARLQYRREETGSHDVSLFTQSGVHLELHYDLNEPNFRLFETLTNIWDHVNLAESGAYCYEMPDDVFYFYHIAHMAKHFEIGGCGVRPFMDLWILEHRVEHDRAARDSLLETGGLLIFANACRNLAEVWFSGLEADAVSLQMQEYLLHGGVYGNLDNRIAVQQTKRGGKLRYALSRIFIPYDTIKFHYPILQKHRWLTPFYEVRRWFKLLFKGRMKSSLHELNVNKSMSKEQTDNTADLLSKLGL